MLSFSLKFIDIKISFSFFAVMAVLFITGNSFSIITALVCCFIHEAGHLIAMKKYGVKIGGLMLYGGGIKLLNNDEILRSKSCDITVLLAGAALNLLCFFIFKSVFESFAYISLALGLFNLLPYKYFDGGRVLEILLMDSPSPFLNSFYKALKAAIVLLTVFVTIYLIKSGAANISLILTLIYIVAAEFFQ